MATTIMVTIIIYYKWEEGHEICLGFQVILLLIMHANFNNNHKVSHHAFIQVQFCLC